MKLISGLLGGNKKDDNFFLELKDEPDEAMPKANSNSGEVSNNGSKPAATASSDTVKVKDENNQIKEVDAELIKTAESAKTNAVPVEKKKAKSAKTNAVPVEKKKAETKTKEEPKEEPNENTFAPKYLIPKNDNTRRRPGANMNSFLDMASQVKTPMK